MESSSAVELLWSSVISASDVIRSERFEEEGRWLQARTACCSSTGWRARATDKNCCLSTWLARSTASRSWLSRPCCSSSTWLSMVVNLLLSCLKMMFSESFCPGRIEALRAPGGGRLQAHFQLAPAWTTAVAVSALPPPSSSSQSFSSGNLSGAACPALPTTS